MRHRGSQLVLGLARQVHSNEGVALCKYTLIGQAPGLQHCHDGCSSAAAATAASASCMPAVAAFDTRCGLIAGREQSGVYSAQAGLCIQPAGILSRRALRADKDTAMAAAACVQGVAFQCRPAWQAEPTRAPATDV